MNFKVVNVHEVLVDSVGMRDFGKEIIWREHWDYSFIDDLAKDDGIIPPTGQALKETLEKYHGKFTDDPVRFQVIRW